VCCDVLGIMLKIAGVNYLFRVVMLYDAYIFAAVGLLFICASST
jgi:hypothetical protein